MVDPHVALRLKATDADDLAILSAALQDCLITPADMAYLPNEKRFVLVANRFCWELKPDAGLYSRVHSGVRFEGVTAVHTKNIHWPNMRVGAELFELLQITLENQMIYLTFAGGGIIRLEVASIFACYLDDMGEAWPTRECPHHPI